MKDEGFWLVGTSDNAHQSLYEIDLKGKIGIVMGAEGKGLRRLTKENVDSLIKIPINAKSDSLNVSNAASVAMFQLQKNITKI